MRATPKGIFLTMILAVSMTLSMPVMASAKDSSKSGSRTTTSSSKSKSSSPSKTSSSKSSSSSKKSSGSSSSSTSSKKTVEKKSSGSSTSSKKASGSSTPTSKATATKADAQKTETATHTATSTSTSSQDRASGTKVSSGSSNKKSSGSDKKSTGSDKKSTGSDKKSSGSDKSSKRTSTQQGSVQPNSGASNWPSSNRASASSGRQSKSDRTGSRVASGSGTRRSSGGSSRHVSSGVKHDWSVPSPPPARAYRPVGRHIHHPVLRVGYHPRVGCPIISSILGVTFGTMYVATLDYLLSKEYEIDGYDGSTIYLRNVREMGFTWPDATMYYDDAGQLTAAQFIYSTSFDSTTRYNRLYSDLCETYGDPMEVVEEGYLTVCTWYGSDETGYVTLEYDFTDGRYYTILSYGI